MPLYHDPFCQIIKIWALFYNKLIALCGFAVALMEKIFIAGVDEAGREIKRGV